MNDAVNLNSNEFWGKRFGKYIEAKPKGCSLPWGFVFQQRQFGSGKDHNAKQKSIKLINVNTKWFK
jgi:hypothetical protein